MIKGKLSAIGVIAVLVGVEVTAYAAEVPFAHQKARQEFADLFDKRDFAALDTLVSASILERRVLADGELHLPDMMALGFGEGRLVDPEEKGKGKPSLQAQVLAWQRAKPASPAAAVAEALMWRAWAFSLRGQGSDDETERVQKLNPLAIRYFQQYIGKAYKSLLAHKDAAAMNPLWYELMLNLQADIDKPLAEARATHQEGIARFPWYYPIHEAMIYRLVRARQDREVRIGKFIDDVSRKEGDRMYARLWRTYDDLELRHGNLFQDAPVNWPRMRKGLSEGLKLPAAGRISETEQTRYDTLASFACRAGDWATYRLAHPGTVTNQVPHGAWRFNYREDLCNRMADAGLPKM